MQHRTCAHRRWSQSTCSTPTDRCQLANQGVLGVSILHFLLENECGGRILLVRDFYTRIDTETIGGV